MARHEIDVDFRLEPLDVRSHAKNVLSYLEFRGSLEVGDWTIVVDTNCPKWVAEVVYLVTATPPASMIRFAMEQGQLQQIFEVPLWHPRSDDNPDLRQVVLDQWILLWMYESLRLLARSVYKGPHDFMLRIYNEIEKAPWLEKLSMDWADSKRVLVRIGQEELRMTDVPGFEKTALTRCAMQVYDVALKTLAALVYAQQAGPAEEIDA